MDKKTLKQQLAAKIKAASKAQQAEDEQATYKEFAAAELYCPKCKAAMPVRGKTLLYLPKGELQDYLCSRCGTSLGTRQG